MNDKEREFVDEAFAIAKEFEPFVGTDDYLKVVSPKILASLKKYKPEKYGHWVLE